LVFNYTGNSLLDVLKGGSFVPVATITKSQFRLFLEFKFLETWIPGTIVLPFCNATGFNVPQARIGISMNNEDNCTSNGKLKKILKHFLDSIVGFGMSVIQIPNLPSAGHRCTFSADCGGSILSIVGAGYVFVRNFVQFPLF
jgi:hypothetical protein